MRSVLLSIGLVGLGLGLLALREVWSPWLPGDSLPALIVALRSLVWVGVTFGVIRAIDHGMRGRIQRRSGRPAPRLLRELVAAAVLVASASGLAIFIFGAPPTAALTTSGVLVAVIGFAVRSMIADLFYGVTLALERPFDIGDWVGIADGAAEQVVGRVEEFTWRSVKVLTRNNLRVIVPNSLLATNHVVNYDQPDPTWRKHLRITLDYDVQPDDARRVLLAAAHHVPAMRSLPRDPEALVVEYRPEGVVWELRYWVPSYDEASRVGEELNEALLRGLRFAGISVPRPRREVLHHPLEAERAAEREVHRRWIDQVALFAPLPPDEREALQTRARRIELPAGIDVVRKGDAGASLFVIHEGALEVRFDGPTGLPASVMGPGDVFGEMSLLTGDDRTATVTTATTALVSEITKADVEPLLQRHGSLARDLAGIMEERARADVQRAALHAAADARGEGPAIPLADRVRAWFKLPTPRTAERPAPPAP